MSISVATNAASLRARTRLSTALDQTRSSAGHLASGRRIRSAVDDASSLSISEGLTSRINGLTQSIANISSATALADTADSSLETVSDVLQRMRSLLLHAANSGAVSRGGVVSIADQIGSLTQLLNAIAENTASHGQRLLDGSYIGRFQTSPGGGNGVILDLSHADMHADNVGGSASGDGVNLTVMKIFQVDDKGIYSINGAAADLMTMTNAIRKAVTIRSHVGAVHGQLDHARSGMMTARTALVTSRSSLLDADMAAQAVSLVRARMTSRAAAAVVAQANAQPQMVLQLLDAVPTGGGSGSGGSGSGSGSGGADSGSGSSGSRGSGGGYDAASGARADARSQAPTRHDTASKPQRSRSTPPAHSESAPTGAAPAGAAPAATPAAAASGRAAGTASYRSPPAETPPAVPTGTAPASSPGTAVTA